MPDINEKLDRFRQIVLEDAAAERAALLGEVTRERETRLQEAEAQIKRETDELVQNRSTAITAELGREESRRLLADQRAVAARREEIAHEVFAAVRERILEFTETEAYLPHLKKLYTEAFSALGNPYDGVCWLRPQDMRFSKDLAAVLPGKFVTFQEGNFQLGGLADD